MSDELTCPFYAITGNKRGFTLFIMSRCALRSQGLPGKTDPGKFIRSIYFRNLAQRKLSGKIMRFGAVRARVRPTENYASAMYTFRNR